MVDEKILKLREELNNSIKYEKDYEKIYKLSIDLDRLITEYYNAKLKQMMKV
ncbi:MAG: Spo0E family sporulation regulatory protein-aspartic acid phosphatase [Firmicutes bacterium]|nr:Spo0E family sporulation regulatory protein-aspartic acid phosphatase [Bacillota bacterium]